MLANVGFSNILKFTHEKFFMNIRLIWGYNALPCLGLDVGGEENEKYSYLDF